MSKRFFSTNETLFSIAIEEEKQEKFVLKCEQLGLISVNQGFHKCVEEVKWKILDSRNAPLPLDYITKLKSIPEMPFQLLRLLDKMDL